MVVAGGEGVSVLAAAAPAGREGCVSALALVLVLGLVLVLELELELEVCPCCSFCCFRMLEKLLWTEPPPSLLLADRDSGAFVVAEPEGRPDRDERESGVEAGMMISFA